ncbi:MAG: DUF4294 domain-containing protein [Bacteroidales bacterium]|nr:DUF4294 domain-containing protein [Bacteroidales bacterium]
MLQASDAQMVQSSQTLQASEVLITFQANAVLGVDTSDAAFEKWLPEVDVFGKELTEEEKKARRRLIYNVRRAYPYAVLAADKLHELERLKQEAKTRKDRRAAMKKAEEQIKADFEEDLRSMTISQGKILFKLIYRQTQKPSYHLLKEFRGGWSAFSYQVVAVFWGYNLKKKYDPVNDPEDALIEMVAERIESGELSPIEVRKKHAPANVKPYANKSAATTTATAKSSRTKQSTSKSSSKKKSAAENKKK